MLTTFQTKLFMVVEGSETAKSYLKVDFLNKILRSLFSHTVPVY